MELLSGGYLSLAAKIIVSRIPSGSKSLCLLRVCNTGQVHRVTSTGSSVAVDGLNMPIDLKQADAHAYYVFSLGDGSVKKIMY